MVLIFSPFQNFSCGSSFFNDFRCRMQELNNNAVENATLDLLAEIDYLQNAHEHSVHRIWQCVCEAHGGFV